ncbi:MAG: peptidoglycan -binding protein [Rhodospirillaceae bacterium]|nr:peptidoglycan -binding protein [Rhodospirillales bacterium]
MLGRRARRTIDIWPGFVDALAGLLMVIIFVLLVFVLAQFFLGSALSGREQALSQLGREMASLVEQLSLEKKANDSLRGDLSKLSGQLTASEADRERVSHDVAALQALKAELEARIAELDTQVGDEKQISAQARAETALMNQQLAALRDELARVAAALDVSEKQASDQKVVIADLGKRLNVALAGKVEELQRYRSEFFGKLRQVLGNRPGIRIEGDRFVFQSEVLFDTASAEMGLEGIEQVRQLAKTLNEISRQIPKDVNWVLRVDGHTDRRPIASGRYPSNWELSTARAITVVRTLAANGVPPERLAAAGFGEFQPLEKGEGDEAFAKNRRIEIRLDAR